MNMKKTKLTAVCLLSILAISVGFQPSSYAKVYSGKIVKNNAKVEALIDSGKYAEAQKQCEEALAKNTNNHAARVQLGSIYSNQYKLDAAQRELTKVLEKDPYNSDAHNVLGSVYYRKTTSSNMDVIKNIQKYYQMALEEFEKSIELNSSSYKAYNNAGKIYQEMGRINEAEWYYKKALEIEPKYSSAIENLGSVHYTKNQINPAIDMYNQAIELNSKNSSAYYKLGEAYIAKSDYSKAINNLQTSLYLFPNSAPVHDLLGRAYEMQGNEAAAITEYKKSLLIKPEYAPPYLRLSNIYQNRGDDELAISELKSAIAMNPDFQEGKLKIADLSLNIRKTDQAIKYYHELLNSKNYSAVALKRLAGAYYVKAQDINANADMTSESDYVDVENALKQAIQYNPDDIQLYLALLRVSRLTSQDPQSEFYLSKIVNNTSNKPISHIVKGEAYLTFKKYIDARKEFRHAIKNINRTEDLLSIGQIFITNRQFQSAREAYNKVLTKEPNNLKAQRSLERIHNLENQALAKINVAREFYKEKQMQAAIEAYRDCLSLNPSLAEAQLEIAKAFEKEKYYFNAMEHYTAYINLGAARPEEVLKYQKRINKLSIKVKKMQASGKEVKKFTRI